MGDYCLSIYEGADDPRLTEDSFSTMPRAGDLWVHKGAQYRFTEVHSSIAFVERIAGQDDSVTTLTANLNQAIRRVVDAEDRVDALESDLSDARRALDEAVVVRDLVMANLKEAMRKAKT